MRILLIEDNVDHVALIDEQFSQITDIELHHQSELSAGLSQLSSGQFDILLCDLNLPDSPIQSTAKKLKELQIETPIVILTSLNSYEMAGNLLQGGIQDYIPKDELSPTLLHRVCKHAIGRKQHQLELERRNSELQAFCESLSHDLKSPVVRIAQVSDLIRDKLQDDGSLSDKDLTLFNSIERSADSSLDLIDELYDYLSIDYRANDYRKINAATVIKAVDKRVRASTDLNYKLNLADTLPNIYGNKALLTLMFSILVGNGVKYNRNTPEIEVTAEVDSDTNQTKINIQDNGIGIDEKYHDQIFKPFSRLHNNQEFEGTGLGLGIVKRIADCHHGAINVDSKLNAGSMFTVTLPAQSGSAQYLS